MHHYPVQCVHNTHTYRATQSGATVLSTAGWSLLSPKTVNVMMNAGHVEEVGLKTGQRPTPNVARHHGVS